MKYQPAYYSLVNRAALNYSLVNRAALNYSLVDGAALNYSLVDGAVQCTLIPTCQYFGHWRHLNVAEFCKGVQVGRCEGVIPHVCIHCRAVEKWPFWIPGSNNACLMDERKKHQQCKKNTITQDNLESLCPQKINKNYQAACIF